MPVTVKFPPITTLSGKAKLILLFETVVAISFAVPSNVNVSVPTVTVSLLPESAATVSAELIAAVPAAVSLPCASTVKVGIAVLEPYEAAVTEVLANLAAVT